MKVLVVGLYIPPWYNAARNRSLYNYTNDCILLLKSLFSIGIDDIEEGCQYIQLNEQDEYITNETDFPAASTPTMVGPMQRAPDLSPFQDDRPTDFYFLPKAANVPSWILKPKDQRWRETDLKSIKFVDECPRDSS